MCDVLIGSATGTGSSLLAVALVAMLGILAVAGAALLVLHTRRTPRASPASGSALPEHPAVGLLKERLARGEIDPDEFERRLLALLVH